MKNEQTTWVFTRQLNNTYIPFFQFRLPMLNVGSSAVTQSAAADGSSSFQSTSTTYVWFVVVVVRGEASGGRYSSEHQQRTYTTECVCAQWRPLGKIGAGKPSN